MSQPLVELKGIKKHFLIKKDSKHPKDRTLKAVDGVDLVIYDGETIGLVGESGCGKSTLGRTLLKLHPATSGQIIYRDVDITDLNTKRMRPYRKKLQIIFQDPMAALNPRMTIYQSVRAPLDVPSEDVEHLSDEQKYQLVVEKMKQVGLSEKDLSKYPHELSGGQRQRIVIARALISNPDLIVCDEPVSALDVSVRAQVLNLLKEIQNEQHISYLFISHDLSVVRYLCDRVAVMYLGKIVELATAEDLFAHPYHPYTKALLSSIPVPDIHHKKEEIVLEGEVPSPIDPPTGCRFHTRCPHACDRCKSEEPTLRTIADGQQVACFYAEEIAMKKQEENS